MPGGHCILFSCVIWRLICCGVYKLVYASIEQKHDHRWSKLVCWTLVLLCVSDEPWQRVPRTPTGPLCFSLIVKSNDFRLMKYFVELNFKFSLLTMMYYLWSVYHMLIHKQFYPNTSWFPITQFYAWLKPLFVFYFIKITIL